MVFELYVSKIVTQEKKKNKRSISWRNVCDRYDDGCYLAGLLGENSLDEL